MVVVQTNVSSMTLLCRIWLCYYDIGPRRPKFSCMIFMCCDYSMKFHVVVVFIHVVVVFIHVVFIFMLVVEIYTGCGGIYFVR